MNTAFSDTKDSAQVDERHPDVVVVGAGPTGLLLAGDLAAAGVRTTVLERRATESNLSRAFAVHARTLEVLDARGLADDLLPLGTRLPIVQPFNGARIRTDRLPSRFPYVLVTPQYNVERLLERRAVAAGARIVRGAEVVAVGQDEYGVQVTVRSPAEQGHPVETRYRARYLVGADGVHSQIRKALDVPFPGRSAVQSVTLADVRLTEEPPGVLTGSSTATAFAFVASFGDGWYRVMAWSGLRQLPDSAPVDLTEVAEITRQAYGTDFGMHDPRFLSRFHSDERQAPRYRVGRVFLTGDAAHVHSPMGGQGMNTGLQDAANLGWKLAAAVHDWAPADLLDSYQAERHPVGQTVLRSSGMLLRMVLANGWWQRAAARVAAAVVSNVPAINTRVARTVSGIGVHYPAPGGSHRLTGQPARDVALAGSSTGAGRLYEALRDGLFVMLAPSAHMTDIARPWSDRVRVEISRGTAGRDGTSAPYVLVRPDGYVAWAGHDERGARHALTTWCGASGRPATARHS